MSPEKKMFGVLYSYFAIRHPIVFRQFFNKRVARCVILAIWVVASLLFVPVLIVHHEQHLKLRNEILGKFFFFYMCFYSLLYSFSYN